MQILEVWNFQTKAAARKVYYGLIHVDSADFTSGTSEALLRVLQ